MDRRTYVTATSAVQAVLASAGRAIAVDGKFGQFTLDAYKQSPALVRAQADAVITALAPGETVASLHRFRTAEKAHGLDPAAEALGAANWPKVVAAIMAEGRRRGWRNPSLVVAQAAHESGWGKSALAGTANNYGGLKSGVKPNYASGTVSMRTAEGFGSGRHYVTGSFLKFNSVEDWVKTQFDYLERKGGSAIKQVESAAQFADTLKKFGYFTDSGANYVAGLQSALRSVNVA